MTPIIPPAHAIHPVTGKVMRLGKQKVRKDPRTLKMGAYLSAALPPAPPAVDYTKGQTSWGELMNDQLGDCTCAAVLHACQSWTLNSGEEVAVTDAMALAAYEKFCGYNPQDPSSDQGGIELNVLNSWKASGTAIIPDALSAFMSVQPGNLEHVKQAIDLFGGVYIGLELPVTAQAQVGTCWAVDPQAGDDATPGGWGGHAVWVCKYDGVSNVFTCITWGQLQPMTKDFWLTYVDEAYALVSPAWFKADGSSPSGFDLEQLMLDLALVR